MRHTSRFTLMMAIALAAAAVLVLAAGRPRAQDVTPSARLAAFVDELVGGRRTAGRGDMTAARFDADLSTARADLARLHAIDRTKLSPDEDIDWRFAESVVAGDEIRLALEGDWRKNPNLYFRPALFESALTPAPGLAARLGRQVADLADGRRNLSIYVPRWQEEAVAGASAALARLDAASAHAAVAGWLAFLRDELPKRPKGDWAIGEAAYNAMLAREYLLPYDAEALWTLGWDAFARTEAELADLAKTIDSSKTWLQIANEVKADQPGPDRMIEAHQLWVDRAREHILSKGLIPIPWKERVEVVPLSGQAAYYGTFSGARGPDADGVFVGHWRINPYDPAWDAQARRDYMLEHDWGVIIVTAPHETYGGHHVQRLYQLHNPRPLRRAFGNPVFTEGWGLYNEQLMQETGFFPNERIHLRQLQLRLWRIARVVWDVGVHTGRMSFEDAVRLLTDRVGFLRWAAEKEVEASVGEPGYRIAYYVGMNEILRMREDDRAKMGGRFTLSDFHRRLLEVGNMPPALMRAGLFLSHPVTAAGAL
jgi:uncharacterized protein (DUF885 family)